MARSGIEVSLEGSLQGATLLADLSLAVIKIFVGGTDGEGLTPVVLNSGTDTYLQVHRQIRGAVIVIDGRGVVGRPD